MAPKDFTDCPNTILDESCRSSVSTQSQANVSATRKQRQMHVSFSPNCRVTVYPMHSSKTKSRAWYAQEDYIRFRSATKKVSEAADTGKIIEGEEMFFGLNSTRRIQAEFRAQRRHEIWDAVLDGQDLCQTPYMVAAQSARISLRSVQEAQLAAALLVKSLRS